MASVRERQKMRRTREIVETATSLFSERGFEETSIEDIADRAVVAPGTIYNYFGSKDGLLREIVAMHIEDRREQRMAILSDPPHDLIAAVDEIVDLMLDTSLERLNKDIWRQVLASAVGTLRDDSDLLELVTSAILEQFESLYEVLQSRKELSSDIAASDLAEASLAIADFHFYRMVCDDNVTIDATKDRIKRQLRILLKSWE